MNAIVLALLYTAAQVNEPIGDFHHDFRKAEAPRGLIILNPKGERFARLEPEGLRVTLPKERKDLAPIAGVKTTFSLSGDFEVTGAFEILEAETPAAGFGVGVSMFVQKAPPSPEGAGIYRLVKPGGRQVIYWDRSIGKQGEQMRFEGNMSACDAKVGRLRLKRVGNILHYQWAAGLEEEDFHELKQVDFGPDDIKSLSIRGQTSKQPCALDVHILELRIRSGKPLVPAAAAPAPAEKEPTEPERQRSAWWLAILAGVVVAVLVGAGAARRRRGQPATTTAGGEAREVRCPSCEKRLKVPAQAAGKTIKCPGCAVAFVA